jgi:hypothetical protein
MMGAIAVFLLCTGVTPAWSSDTAEETAVSIAENYEVDWIWGDVLSKTANSVTIQYLDYEDDIEKQLTLTVDEATAYENVASLAEIAVGDTLSIDYAMQANGDGLAKLISKEIMTDTGVEDVQIDTAVEDDLAEPVLDDPSVSSIPVE